MVRTILITLLLVTGSIGQDENSDDVFEMKPRGEGTVRVFSLDAGRSDTNEGMETFQASTEMVIVENATESAITTDTEETSTESLVTDPSTTQEEKSTETMVTEREEMEPITPLDVTLTPFDTTETEVEQDDDVPSLAVSSETILTTFPPSTVFEDITGTSTESFVSTDSTHEDISDRRVLKEKEGPLLPLLKAEQFITKASSSTPSTTSAVSSETTLEASDPSTVVNSEEEPFDESAISSLFEQDGSFVDTSATSNGTPAFPIVEMSEEDTTIIKQGTTTTQAPIMVTSTSTTTTTTEEVADTEVEVEDEAETEPTTTTTTEEATTSVASEDSDLQDFSKFAQSNANSSKVFSPEKAARTPVTVRITSIQFSEQFEDSESGPFKKLVKSVVPALTDIFAELLEDNLVDVQVVGFSKGSVIVHADLLTKRGVADPQKLVNDFEAALSTNNNQLAENTVDSLSVTVEGIASTAYVDSLANQPSAGRSSLVLIVIITCVVLIIFTALIIIFLTNKRKKNTQGTLKLSDDNLVRIENASTAYTNHPVNLMSYGGSETGEKVAYKTQRHNEREI